MTDRNGVELIGIGLGLVQNVSKLVVHRLEVILVHHLKVIDAHGIDLEQRNLDTAFGKTDNLGTRGGIVGRRANQEDDAGTVGLEEFLTGYLVIYVEPQILAKHCQVNRVLVGGGNQVVVHVGADIRHLVQERQVVLVKVILLEELIKLIGVGRGIECLVHIREDGITQLVFTAR